MHAPPVLSAAPRSRPTPRAALFALLLVTITSPALVQAQAQTFGQWSDLSNEMAGVQVHMALVRGKNGDPYHSRVVWWGAEAGHAGVLGWNHDGTGCGTFPTGNFVPLTPTPWYATKNLFCNAATVLGSGELLAVGGSDATLEGLRDALTYSPAVDPAPDVDGH